MQWRKKSSVDSDPQRIDFIKAVVLPISVAATEVEVGLTLEAVQSGANQQQERVQLVEQKLRRHKLRLLSALALHFALVSLLVSVAMEHWWIWIGVFLCGFCELWSMVSPFVANNLHLNHVLQMGLVVFYAFEVIPDWAFVVTWKWDSEFASLYKRVSHIIKEAQLVSVGYRMYRSLSFAPFLPLPIDRLITEDAAEPSPLLR